MSEGSGYAVGEAKRAAKCKGCKESIEKGALRIGSKGGQHDSTFWKHLNCWSQKQANNMKEKGVEPSGMEGWDDLSDDQKKTVQERIEALLAGEVKEDAKVKEGGEKKERKKRERKEKGEGSEKKERKERKSKKRKASGDDDDGGEKKKKRKPKDPNAPKRPLSGYMRYSQSVRAEIKSENPEMKPTEILTETGRRWKELSEEDKKPFNDAAKAAKPKYDAQVAAYKKKKKAEEADEEEGGGDDGGDTKEEEAAAPAEAEAEAEAEGDE